MEIQISVPENVEITPEIKNAFMNAEIFDWSRPYCFCSIDRFISSLIYEISISRGNNTYVIPCYFYYCPINEALALDTR